MGISPIGKFVLTWAGILTWGAGISPVLCSAEQDGGNPPKLNMGINLAGFSDWGTEYPTLDLMKSTRGWFTHNGTWVEGGKNTWDTNLLKLFEFDRAGWPLGPVPLEAADQESPQVLSTLWAKPGALGPGPFVCTWSGDGTVVFDMGAELVKSSPGTVVFKVSSKADLLRLTITRSSPDNPVRDIRVVPQAYASLTGTWNPQWLEKVRPFHTLRFMDWGSTNNSPLKIWSDRTDLGSYKWTGEKGAPYEAMIDLCNELNADPWVCVPHQADDAYITAMATLFRDRLKPSLKVYVEYSNETWNSSFDQAQWLKAQGAVGTSWPEKIAPSIQKTLDVWALVWKNRPKGLVRVVGVQTSWIDEAVKVTKALRPGSFDAVAGTFYIGFSERSLAQLKKWGAKAEAEDVLDLARDDMNYEAFPRVRALDNLCHHLKVPLVFYEGGPHFTSPERSDQPYIKALGEAQKNPGIYNLLRDWFTKLKSLHQADTPSGLLSMYYELASSQDGQFGAWGALETVQTQPPYMVSAPKYQALLDEMDSD